MNALKIAAILSAILSATKGGAYAWSGSVAVLASFLDSLVDSFLSFVNFKVSRLSQERADKEHPYGHGGFEVMTALIQGGLIAGSGLFVWFQSLDRVFSPRSIDNITVERLPWALVIMVISVIGSFVIVKILASKKQKILESDKRSLSLDADHAHYSGDIWQNSIAILGVLGTWVWHAPWIDVAAGAISGTILLATAYPLLRESAKDIMNVDGDPKLREQVERVVNHCGIKEVKGIHRLRTRSLGPNRFVDFHLKLPNLITLIEAHEIGYRIEALIKKQIPGVDILMHLDPESEPDDDFDHH